MLRTVTPSSSVPISPCSDSTSGSTFACGLNASACADSSQTFTMSGGNTFVLRSSQVAALVSPALSSMTSTATASCSPDADDAHLYTAGQMAGLGCGLGLPLLFAVSAFVILYMRAKPQNSKKAYRLPDNHNEYRFTLPPPLHMHPAHRTGPLSRDGSEHGSTRSGPEAPTHMKKVYASMSEKSAYDSGSQSSRAVELPGSPIPHDMVGSERTRTPTSLAPSGRGTPTWVDNPASRSTRSPAMDSNWL